MTMQTASGPQSAGDDRYDEFLTSVGERSRATLTTSDRLFTVDTDGLFEVFLGEIPPDLVAENACSACRAFVRRYGGLVIVGPDGMTESALWSAAAGVPPAYAKAVAALAELVENRPIASVFRSAEAKWGHGVQGGWTHLAVTPPANFAYRSLTETAGQYVAGKTADRQTLQRALAEFPYDVVKKAVALLRTEQLYRSDAILGAGTWLLELHKKVDAVRGGGVSAQRRRDNVVWLAAATAPAGYCHVKSGMIGTLLSDIAEGLPHESVRARFAAKMHPLQYRRPTAAPTATMIARAERVIGDLRAAGSLERRFAKLADVQPVWSPPVVDAPRSEGVFGHLAPARKVKGASDLDADPVVMTWEKFARKVLPEAERIEFAVPKAKASYGAMVTAANPDAPPIMQWDKPDRRNTATWYVYVNGSPASQWGLKSGEYRDVTAVVPHPVTWHVKDDNTHREQSVLFALTGATDTSYTSGAGFFPEFLSSELHEIRKTLEAYAKDAVVAGKDEAEVCGLLMSKGGNLGHTFRVTAGGIRVRYTLDRWD